MRQLSIWLLSFFLSIAPSCAFAWTSSWMAGGSVLFGTNTNQYNTLAPKVGVELTFGTPYDTELGFVGDATIITFKSPSDKSGVISFFGGIVRSHILWDKSAFVDASLGISPRIGGLEEEANVGLGVGGGYKYNLGSRYSVTPRLGYRLLPVSTGIQHTIDLGVIFSVWN